LKTSKEMQKLVTELCEKMKCNLNSENAHLKVQLDENHLELDIRRITPYLVTVSHPFTTSDGEIKVDPEVTFYTLYSQWVPIGYFRQVLVQRPQGGWLGELRPGCRLRPDEPGPGLAGFANP
jgi:hypothetical protein